MQATETGIQHINVKFFVKNPENIQLADVVGVFQKWIQEDRIGDLLIDVADYQHVPEGPGVILIGHNAFYSFDEAEGRLGVLYNRRTAAEGSAHDVLKAGILKTREICQQLAQEPGFAGRLAFQTDTLQIVVNDRNLAPNNDETLAALKSDFETALRSTLGEATYTFDRTSDPRSRFTVDVKSDVPFSI